MLRETENRSILDAVAKQAQIGIDILTDGEMRRASWLHNMTVAVEGFVPHKIMLDWKGPGAATEESHAAGRRRETAENSKIDGRRSTVLEGECPRPFQDHAAGPIQLHARELSAWHHG